MYYTPFAVYHIAPFFITVGVLIVLLVVAQVILFVQTGKLRKRVRELEKQ